jgi:copper transport protein
VILACFAGYAAWLSQSITAPRAFAALAIVLAGASYAMSGHAASASPRWLTLPMVALHASLAIVWVGALPGLVAVIAEKRMNAALTMGRFSRIAFAPVVLLVLGGAALSIIQIAEPQALWSTAYGNLIAAKMACAGAMLGLALFNRFIVTPRLAASDGEAFLRARRSIAAEIILGIAVLALVSATRMTPPPRAIASAGGQELQIHMHGNRAMADLKLLPGGVGGNAIEIIVFDDEFRPFLPLEITVSASRPEAGIEPIVLSARRSPDGIWRSEGLFLPLFGEWQIEVHILIDDFEKTTLREAIILEEPGSRGVRP